MNSDKQTEHEIARNGKIPCAAPGYVKNNDRGDRTKSPELVCPDCGSFPLRLEGEKTLGSLKNCVATCDNCIYQEGF